MVTILCSLGGLYLVYCAYLSISVLVSLHLEAKQLRTFLRADATPTAAVVAEESSTLERFTSYFWDVYLPTSQWGHVLVPLLKPVRNFEMG